MGLMRYNSRGAPPWCPLECLSRLRGNFHARFLGGKGAERPLTYPVATAPHRRIMRIRLFAQSAALFFLLGVAVAQLYRYCDTRSHAFYC